LRRDRGVQLLVDPLAEVLLGEAAVEEDRAELVDELRVDPVAQLGDDRVAPHVGRRADVGVGARARRRRATGRTWAAGTRRRRRRGGSRDATGTRGGPRSGARLRSRRIALLFVD